MTSFLCLATGTDASIISQSLPMSHGYPQRHPEQLEVFEKTVMSKPATFDPVVAIGNQADM